MWSVRIFNIKAAELKDTGTKGRFGIGADEQDPAAHFSIGDIKRRTERLSDAGVSADWGDKVELTFAIDENSYKTKELKVEIFNEGAVVALKQKHVGQGAILLKDYPPGIANVRVPLTFFEKGMPAQPQGYVTFSIEVMEPKPQTALPAVWKLKLSRMKAIDLYDTGSALDKQDPALSLFWGAGKKSVGKTARIKEGGTNVDWPENLLVEVSETDYRSGAELRVEVINEHAVSSLANKSVGVGKVVLKEAIPDNGINWPIVLTFYLKSPAGTDWGIVQMEGLLEAGNMLKAETPYQPPALKPYGKELLVVAQSTNELVDEAPADFIDADLIIQEINVSNLSSSSVKPQVFLQLKEMPQTKDSTEPSKNKASEHSWTVDFRFPLQAATLKSTFLEITILDHSPMLGGPVVVGVVAPCMSFFNKAARVGVPVDFKVDVVDGKGKLVAKISLGVIVKKKDVKPKEFPEGFEKGIVKIFKIRTVNLANTDGLLGGKQDPYCVIKLDGKEVGRTFVLDDKGGSVVFDHLDIRTTVLDKIDLKGKLLIVEAWDKNTMADTLIGTGSVGMTDLCVFGEEVELPVVKVFDGKGQPSGRVFLHAVLEKPPPLKEAVVVFPEGFDTGRVFVRRITGFSIKNTNWMPGNKADPYVTLTLREIGDSVQKVVFEGSTAPAIDAGNHAVWDFLDFEFDCPRSLLADGVFQITVKDKNFATKDSLIGSGVVPLRRSCANIGNGVLSELSVDLTGPDKKPAGRIVLYVEVQKPQSPDELIPKPGFSHGRFNISRIRTFDLKNVEIGSTFGAQNDPYCVVKFVNWTDKTHSKENGGSDCLWDFLLMGTDDIPVEHFIQKQLEITVFDENTRPLPDTLIGQGKVALSLCITAKNLGTEVKLPVKLIGKDGKPSGRVEVYVTVTEPEAVGTVPDSFQVGLLEVKRVTLMGLKAKISGPTINLSLGETIASIGGTQDEEDDPSWASLSWKAPCSRAAVCGENGLVVEIMHDGMMKSKLFGTAKLPLLRAGAKLGQDVQLLGPIENSKGEKVGQISVLSQIRPDSSQQVLTIPVPSSIEDAQLTIGSVKINLSPNLMSKKLFARIEYGLWVECTETKAGGIWADLDAQIWRTGDIERSSLELDKIRIVVFEDASVFKDIKEVASGIASFKTMVKLIENFGSLSPMVLKVELKSGNSVMGSADISCNLASSAEEAALAPTFANDKAYLVTVKEISVEGLIGGDSFGKNDPFVKLSFEKWSATTTVQNEAGRSAKWPNLDSDAQFKLPSVNGSSLNNAMMRLVVKDKNNIASDVVIGDGKFSLRELGRDLGTLKKFVVKLRNKSGRSSGRVEIFATAVALVSSNDSADTQHIIKTTHVEQQTKATPPVAGAGVMAAHPTTISGNEKALLAEMDKMAKAHEEKLAKLTEQLSLMEQVVKSKQDALDGKIGNMEKGISASIEKGISAKLQAQLEVDRSKMLDEISRRTEDLSRSIEQVSLQMGRGDNAVRPDAEDEDTSKRSKKSSKKTSSTEEDVRKKLISSLTLSEVSNVKLPASIADWRLAHVQAWLAFQVELPMHMTAFQKASIDGFMLVRHVDDDLLATTLGVDDELHRKKILEHIDMIKVRQEAVDLELEKRRKLELKRVEAEERERQEEEERQELLEKERKAKELKKASLKKVREEESADDDVDKAGGDKKKASVRSAGGKKVLASTFPKPSATGGNPTTEQNQIDRVKLERAVKTHNAEKRRKEALAAAALMDKNRTWKFEYTGSPKATALTDIWGADTGKKEGTKSYLRAMAAITGDVLGSEEMTQPLQVGTFRKIKTISKTSVLDEVLAEVKEAMFALSTRLIEVRRRQSKADTLKDDDLEAEIGDLDEYAELPPPEEDESPEFEPPPFDEALAHEAVESDENEASQLIIGEPALVPRTAPRRPGHGQVEDKLDRMQLVYEALVHQTNNDSFSTTTQNDKLTRLKLYGGLESLLRLRVSWSQFDALWTRLDSVRSGDLDLKEFKAFFGDLSEFEQNEGTQALSLQSGNPAIRALMKCMYELCDIVRHAGFTVEEMFASFDRNGSGEISAAEFCSLLRLIVGSSFDKRLIYQALFVLDSDRSKSISRDEIFLFVYKVWRSQIAELDSKIHYLDEENELEAARISELLKERKSIVSAIKRNFPREVRDLLQGMSTKLEGPFTTLFNVDRPPLSPGAANSGLAASQRPSDKSLDYSYGPEKGTSDVFARPSSPKRAGAAGEILRFTIKVQSKGSPSRGEAARQPSTVEMGSALRVGAAGPLLARTAL